MAEEWFPKDTYDQTVSGVSKGLETALSNIHDLTSNEAQNVTERCKAQDTADRREAGDIADRHDGPGIADGKMPEDLSAIHKAVCDYIVQVHRLAFKSCYFLSILFSHLWPTYSCVVSMSM